VGVTSIGNTRNPNLPFGGADLIALTGVSAVGGSGPALGLASSAMDIAAFVATYLPDGARPVLPMPPQPQPPTRCDERAFEELARLRHRPKTQDEEFDLTTTSLAFQGL